jgi:hypothetical protein
MQTTNQHETPDARAETSVHNQSNETPLSLAQFRKDWAEAHQQLDWSRTERDLFVEGVLERILERLDSIERIIEPIRKEQWTRGIGGKEAEEIAERRHGHSVHHLRVHAVADA